jgi:hypothetical protein
METEQVVSSKIAEIRDLRDTLLIVNKRRDREVRELQQLENHNNELTEKLMHLQLDLQANINSNQPYKNRVSK